MVILLLAPACNAAGRVAEDAKGTLCDPAEPLPSPSPSFPAARALIDTGDDSVLVNLVVAESDDPPVLAEAPPRPPGDHQHEDRDNARRDPM